MVSQIKNGASRQPTSVDILADQDSRLPGKTLSKLTRLRVQERHAAGSSVVGFRPKPRGRLRNVLNLEDFEAVARTLLPKPLFSFVADGAESDASVRANRRSFSDWSFVPRVLRDTVERDLSSHLFDQTYSVPFGISPMGAAALIAFDADTAIAHDFATGFRQVVRQKRPQLSGGKIGDPPHLVD